MRIRLATNLKQRRRLHVRNYNYTLENTDPSTVSLNTDAWEVIYQVKSATLIDAAALGVEQPEPTARTIARTIAGRIE